MVKWYKEKLGLTVFAKEENDQFAMLGKKVGFLLALWGKKQLKGKNAKQQRITPYWRVTNLTKTVREFSRRGVVFASGIEIRHWGRQAKFSDPEGNTHFLYQEKN